MEIEPKALILMKKIQNWYTVSPNTKHDKDIL